MFLPQTKHRERQTDLIVKITCGLVHPVSLRQYRCYHLLGTRLSHTACDADDRNRQFIQITCCKLPQRIA